MIDATANWIAANAANPKKPVFLIEIENYVRAFTNRPDSESGLSSPIGILQTNPVLQYAALLYDFGGLSFVPSTLAYPGAKNAGNLLFAFLAAGGGSNLGLSDTAALTWTKLLEVDGVGGAAHIEIYWTIMPTASAFSVTWDPGNTINHHNSEFFLVEVDSAYSGFISNSNSGTSPPSGGNATCTAGSSTISVPIGGVLGGDHWFLFLAELAPATGPNAAVLVGWMTSAPLGPDSVLSPDNYVNADGASKIVIAAQATTYPWIVNIDPLQLTVSDLDGGADLADLVFNIQDRGQAITGDMASFTFEGKRIKLLEGYVDLDISDYLVRFTGRIDHVDSDVGNMEYKFTCPDIRKDLSKVIYLTGDDGFATSNDHPKTLLGHPLDILIDLLENQVGYSATDVDVTGIQQRRDKIFSGLEFQFSLTSPPAAKDFIENEILKPLGGYHWTNNLGVIKVHFFYAIDPQSVDTITHDHLLEVALAGQADLVNQVTHRFDADDSGQFQQESVQQDQDSIDKFGLFGEQVIECAGVRSIFGGFWLAAVMSRLIFLRYGGKPLLVDGVPLGWDKSLLEPGDIISVTSSLVPDRKAGVLGITIKEFEVLDREWDFLPGNAKVKLLEIDTSVFKQYLIAPDAEADFTAASSTDQGKYLFMSDDDDVYSDSSPANTLC